MLITAKATEITTIPKDKIIIALDLETTSDAERIIEEVGDRVGAFKIGLQLFASGGPAFVRDLVDRGIRIFLDLKFHDIPNTVAKASVEAARLGVWMFNIHASGGREMMMRTSSEVAETCKKESIPKPKIIAVTVLTSSNAETLKESGVEMPVDFQVRNLARLAAECALDGVVASPHEIALIRETVLSPDFLIVTPGIRPISATNDDQKRVTTPKEALAAGSNYLVIGRPITRAADKKLALEQILGEIGPAS